MSSDKEAGAMPKDWDESQIESCCKNDKNLLIVGVVISIVAIISAILIFVPIKWPSIFALANIVLYCVAFFGIGVLSCVSYLLIKSYCDPHGEWNQDGLALILFCSIIAILLSFAVIYSIEQIYYESHFHNAIKFDTLHQAYSELDCRIIDKFRDESFENKPVWTSKNPNYGKMPKFNEENTRYLVHLISVPEACQK